MNKIVLSLLFLCSLTPAEAQTGLDLQSRVLLRRHRLEMKQAQQSSNEGEAKMLKTLSLTPGDYMLGIVRLKDGATEDSLTAAGVKVLRSRHGFCFVALPQERVEKVAELSFVKKLQLARPLQQKLKKARKATGVDKIHQGIGLPQAYTGKGIICGAVDAGVDPNHLNFKDENGNLRVSMLAYMKANQNATSLDNFVIEKFYDKTNMNKFTTDANTSYHGTHTLGIMAGSYRGTLRSAQKISDTFSKETEEPNPYYGVAYDADLALGCGDLADMIIAYGVDHILNYAYEQNKRCVINLSLGSNTGSHDGMGTVQQFFDACAKKDNAIICISAGNEGDMKIAANKTFTATDKEFKTFLKGYDTQDNNGAIYYNYTAGSTTVYSNNDKPFSISAVIYNRSRARIARTFDITINPEKETDAVYWVSSAAFQQSNNDIIDSNFGQYFTGYVGILWAKDESSNRFYATLDYNVSNSSGSNKDGNYLLGFVVNGEEGQRVDAFCDGVFSELTNYDIKGWQDGSYNGSISDLATGKDIIAVGSFDTSDNWPALDGNVYRASYNLKEGEVTVFSSFGTLVDGRNVPDVLAPGAAIISSVNQHYETAGNSDPSVVTARTTSERGNETWGWAAGTSMAAPHVAGAIALWLEANPNLTVYDVKDIIKETAVVDDAVQRADPVKAGAGKFDAYAGLKEVLRRMAEGIDCVKTEQQELLVTPTGNRSFRVYLAGANSLDIKIYNMAGAAVGHNTVSGAEADITLPGLPKGSYVVHVNGKQSKCVLIK